MERAKPDTRVFKAMMGAGAVLAAVTVALWPRGTAEPTGGVAGARYSDAERTTPEPTADAADSRPAVVVDAGSSGTFVLYVDP